MLSDPERFLPAYLPLERLPVARPVDRLRYLADACAGRRVLDLGAMDETAYRAKQGKGQWLHAALAAQAREVVGVDSSALLPAEGLRTAGNAVIRPGDVMQLERWLDAQPDLLPGFDVVVAGELIEHLPNPLAFLESLRANRHLAGARLLLSTPNATALHNTLIGLGNRESTHVDHLCILSFKTLSTLCLRAGLRSWRIQPYFARFPEMRERQGPIGRRLIDLGQGMVNAAEWCFPLLSFGLIADIRL